MAVRVTGHAGQVRVGYQVAAQLGTWSLELLPEVPRRYRLVAAVSAVSDYWWSQAPLAVHLWVGAEEWVWCPVTAAMDGASLAVSLAGSPQCRPGSVPVA